MKREKKKVITSPVFLFFSIFSTREQQEQHNSGGVQRLGTAEREVLWYCSDKMLYPLENSPLGIQIKKIKKLIYFTQSFIHSDIFTCRHSESKKSLLHTKGKSNFFLKHRFHELVQYTETTILMRICRESKNRTFSRIKQYRHANHYCQI